MKYRTDPITGLEIEVSNEPYVPMYYVCINNDLIPEGNQAMGIGVAKAVFDTKAEANRYRLENGCTATTYIEEV